MFMKMRRIRLTEKLLKVLRFINFLRFKYEVVREIIADLKV